MKPRSFLVPTLVLAAALAVQAEEAAQHAGHAAHQMTPEQLNTLRVKVKQYAPMTDEQIVAVT